MSRHHIIISGTGRAGTTFLVQLLTSLGLDTGFTDTTSAIESNCNAGMERDIRHADAPYVIKSPWLCDYLDDVLDNADIVIDHAIIPVRDLYSAAESRRDITRRTDGAPYSGAIPGGLWHTNDPQQQEIVLANQLYKIIYTIAKRDIPITLLHFPRFSYDAEYLYRKIEITLNGVDYETFLAAFHKVARPELVHRFSPQDAGGTLSTEEDDRFGKLCSVYSTAGEVGGCDAKTCAEPNGPTDEGLMSPLNPLSHPVCVSQPLRMAPSAWTQHIPFAMFLIDVLRPNIVVELGTHTGVSYCAFCQAVKELKLETRCYAVDAWKGDPHSGSYGNEILDNLRMHHDPLYGSFSQLIQTTFDDALNHFDNGTIDLLHIDGYHTYEAVKNDFLNWLPKMSNRGVMLFHDTEVRKGDFGVRQLWQELKQQYPSFEILHGFGLGLLAVGALQTEPLKVLLNTPKSDLLHLREFFYQLGRRLEIEQSSLEIETQLADRLAEPEEKVSVLDRSKDDDGSSSQPASSQEPEPFVVREETPVQGLDPVEDIQERIEPLILEPSVLEGFGSVQVIREKIAPLTLDVSSTAPSRINLLVPTINLMYVFGGYITKFNLARHLAENGYNVRIIIVDRCDYNPESWRQQLHAYAGLENFIDVVELAYMFDRSKSLEVNKDDAFIATTWWTAHIAHRAVKDLGKERFLYLIQEYEPLTFPMGTFAALADQTYRFPHYAVFSAELLRDYFRRNAMGVFARGNEIGDQDSISFRNTITSVGPLSVEDIVNRTPKKLLFYSRPEAHAARNMFEMALLALSQAIKSRYFEGDWEFHGIGTVETSSNIRLADGVSMQVLPRQPQDAYREVLRAHDLGLSLMYTPHPSLVPIEMASAGMLVVTNTYANKTREALRDISSNIIAVPPTIEDVSLGLREAAANIEDYDRRVRGSRVNWSTLWDSSFDSSFMNRVKEFLDGAQQARKGAYSAAYDPRKSDALNDDKGNHQLLFPTSVAHHVPSSAFEPRDMIESLRRQLIEKEGSLNVLTQLLAQHETQLRRITNTLGWRLLSYYGPIKYSYVLPAYNWIRSVFQPRVPAQPPETLYQIWARRCEELRYNPERAAKNLDRFNYKPTISIIMPVYNVSREDLSRALDSVLNQYYPFWELCICDDASTLRHVRSVLEDYAASDKRIKVVFSEENRGIAIASNRALELATGEFIGLLDDDDEITPDALYEVIQTLQEVNADLIYSDEDKLDTEGSRCDPFFKPAWSPDLLFSCNYISHFGVYRKSIVDQIAGFRRGFDGSQDYDLVLRFTEKSDKIAHIPKILYHWRKVSGSAAASTLSKPYAYEAGEKALTETLRRREIRGEATREIAPGFYRVRRDLVSAGKVSIVIPTRDRLELLRQCIDSIESKTQYNNYEIVIVNNASRERDTLEYLAHTPHRVIHDAGSFNYSRLNNRAAREVDGDYLLLLNNDIEVISGEWLSAMIEHAQRPEVGAVGAKLLYPDNRVQHAGVVLGLGGVANHSHRFRDGYEDPGYFGFANRIRNYSAVTAACLMIRRKLFEEIGGLDEKNLAVTFNDVDLCLRLRRQGYLIVYTPYALLYHKESASRGHGVDPDEDSYMMTKWRNEILSDPYYSPNLTLKTEDFSIDCSKPESFYCVYTQEMSSEPIGCPREGGQVGQKFTIDQDNLCAVAIEFGTFQSVCKGTVRFHLWQANDPNYNLAVAVDASVIRDNEYHMFAFDPVPNSSHTAYYFFVEYVSHEPHSPLAIWKSSFDSTAMGPHFENHEASSGTLSFKVFCQKQFRA
jgi:GT2 family glycosyltransferase